MIVFVSPILPPLGYQRHTAFDPMVFARCVQDFQGLERECRYDGFTKDSPTVRNFWAVVHGQAAGDRGGGIRDRRRRDSSLLNIYRICSKRLTTTRFMAIGSAISDPFLGVFFPNGVQQIVAEPVELRSSPPATLGRRPAGPRGVGPGWTRRRGSGSSGSARGATGSPSGASPPSPSSSPAMGTTPTCVCVRGIRSIPELR